jgi:hypothetical protein
LEKLALFAKLFGVQYLSSLSFVRIFPGCGITHHSGLVPSAWEDAFSMTCVLVALN